MHIGTAIKLFINLMTIITILIVITIVTLIIKRKNDLSEEVGISGKTYLVIVGIVEVFYIVSIILILTSMGINVIQYLQNLEFGKFVSTINSVDTSKIKFTGTLGWIAFGTNCVITFLAPVYLLMRGGKRLPWFLHHCIYIKKALERHYHRLQRFLIFLRQAEKNFFQNDTDNGF